MYTIGLLATGICIGYGVAIVVMALGTAATKHDDASAKLHLTVNAARTIH